MDFTRDLLRAIEQNPEMDRSIDFFPRTVEDLSLPAGHSDSELAYHLTLLIDAGFIDGRVIEMPIIRGLTWDGHEFLDNIKTDSIWNKVKAQAGPTLTSASMKILAMLAESEVKKHLGLP